MWHVVIRDVDGGESISDGMSYSEAYADYEKRAAKINKVGARGEYLYPETRISLRKI